MSGAGVVPWSGAFESRFIESFKEGDGPCGFELLDERTKGGTHDSAANKDDVGMLSLGNEGHDQSPLAAALAVTEYPRADAILKLQGIVKALSGRL